MSTTITTPNMSLVLPVVGSEPGPTWASDLNTAFSAVDSHNHSTGQGVQVPTAGININSDLTFANFNSTNVRSSRYTNNGSPLALATDLNCVYVSGGNMYFNNSAGNQVQITAGAALNAASIGGIGGDYVTSGASEFYTNAVKTFFFTQSANTTANLDAGSVSIHENVASSKSVTLKSPGSLAANYNVTFPAALPASTKIMSIDNTGQLGDSYDVDAVTLQIVSSVISVKDLGINTTQLASNSVTTAKIADDAVTQAKLGANNYTLSTTTGAILLGASGPYTAITQLSAAITTTGRSVRITFVPDTSTNEGNITQGTSTITIGLFRDAGLIQATTLGWANGTVVPSSVIEFFDAAPTTASHTYSIQYKAVNQWNIQYTQLLVTEV